MQKRTFVNFLLFAMMFVLPLGLTACGGSDSDDPGMDAETTTSGEMPMDDHDMQGDAMEDDVATARMEDGVQVAEIEAGPMGYRPREIALAAGVPARLTFTRTVDSACSSQVKIPAFDVPVTDLPRDEPVTIAFTPAEGGSFEFICGMDMQRGSIMVRS